MSIEEQEHSEEFDIDIRRIELDIVKFLVDGMVKYSGRDPIFANIICYFFTRQVLTQKKLKELTELSAGSISQTLQRFEEMNIISTKYREERYEKIYSMDGISFGKSEYLMNLEEKYENLVNRLDGLKERVENNNQILSTRDNFPKITSLISELTLILKTLPIRLKMFEEQLNKLQKEKNQ